MQNNISVLADASASQGHIEKNLRRLLNPSSIAVVGASADSSKAGSQALRSLNGFPGRVVAVHPRESVIQGRHCYPTFADIPEPVDLAILAIPAQHCVQAARDAAASGVGGIFIISGGFGESGAAGARLQEELADICRTSGMRLLGPNTSGFINPHKHCVASFVPGVDQLPKGRIAVIAQSGGVNLSIAFQIQRLREGISLAVGLGNAVDVDAADVLGMLASDPNTAAIALHLEGVPQGRKLFEVLSTVTRSKPVVALVAGRSDIGEFAVSHTGNLMGSYQRTISALTQAGAVVVNSTEELAQAASILAHGRLPPKARNGFALVTGQAGPGLLIIDGLKAAGLDVPELKGVTIEKVQSLLPPMTFVKNPVDTGRPGPGFTEVISAVAADDRIDAIFVYALHEPAVLDPSAALLPAVNNEKKPIVFGTLGTQEDLQPVLENLVDARIPAVLGPERLVLAGIALDADSRAQWRLTTSSIVSQPLCDTATLTRTLNENQAKAFIASYGIRTPQRRFCVGKSEAIEAFTALVKPVVVKIAADDVPHKTEVGGVFLRVGNLQSLCSALESIERIPTKTPGQFLIEEMAPVGVELIVGAVNDSSWGPCVVIGLGGVLAEAVSDSSVRLAPISELDAVDMLDGLRGKKLLDGFRNLPVCDRSAISEVAVKIGQILIDHPEIAELEINPLRVNAEGAVALDALVVLKNQQEMN